VGGFSVKKEGLARGVQKTSSGKFESRIAFGGKHHQIGTFDTLEQASAARMSVKINLSAFGADEVDAAFGAAKTKALASFVAFKRELPKGVYKTPSGKYQSQMRFRGKTHNIGTFDSPEQASAAYMSVRKDLDGAKLSACGPDEVDAIFKKAVEAVGGFAPKKRDRGLPTGVYKLPSGKFQAKIQWCGKNRSIGAFDTPEEASAAYMSMKKDLDNAKLSAFGADKVDAILDAAKKKAFETVQSMKESDEYGDEFLV
jgi:hypothetical protein